MATTIQNHHQPFAHSLNGHGHGNGNGNGNGNALVRYVAHRPADDDDSIATEQFPEFDPSHDGSEEESGSNNGDGHYTHRAANGDGHMNRSAVAKGGKSAAPREEPEQPPLFDDIGDDDRLSPIDPSPEPEHQTLPPPPPQSPPREDRMVLSPITSPPYWAHNHNHNSASAAHYYQNNINSLNISTESLVPGAITLQDNEADDVGEHQGRDSEASGGAEVRTSYGRDRNKACWAKSVEVTDYVIVNGSATNIGAFVVWNIRVQTLSGPYMNIRKRYSEFDDFRHQLIQTFPAFEAAVPGLPPKSVISKFRPRFLEKRRAGLQYFLNCILLNPEFSGSPVLKEFLFS